MRTTAAPYDDPDAVHPRRRDDFVSPASLERNFDACASIDRQKMMIPGAGHTMAASTDPERYWRRVTNFVTRTFGL